MTPWLAAGTGAYAIKIATILAHRAHLARHGMDAAPTIWEVVHGIGTTCIALSIAAINVRAISSDDLLAHLVTTVQIMLFGAGLVSRVSVRPVIAMSAVGCVVLPTVLVYAMRQEPIYYYIGSIHLAAMVAAMDTIRHNYQNLVRQIVLQLDTAALARRDPLTGLLNRLGLMEGFRRVKGEARLIALHYFDLDGFKPINDTFGHAAGDEVLRQIAARLEAECARPMPVARVGGDEFAVIQASNGPAIDTAEFARRLEEAVTRPITLLGREVAVGLSLGVATTLAAKADLISLLQAADTASYAVKQSKASRPKRRA